jgi:hypothetical protein
MISLPIELQISLMAAGKRYAPRLRKAYDEALETQHQDTLERQKLAVEKECEKKGEEYIEGCDFSSVGIRIVVGKLKSVHWRYTTV